MYMKFLSYCQIIKPLQNTWMSPYTNCIKIQIDTNKCARCFEQTVNIGWRKWWFAKLWILDEENDELNKPWILDEGNDLNFGKGKWMHSDFWMKRMQTAWVPESSLPLSLSCKLMGIWKPMFLKPLFSLKSKLWLLPLPVTVKINSITYCKHINT